VSKPNFKVGSTWKLQPPKRTAASAVCLKRLSKRSKTKPSFSVERILEIEAEVRHDVIAFLTNVNEHVGDAGRHIHVGMTSSDVLDTGLALQMKRSVVLLRVELDALADALRTLARAHKSTEMIGRSHAIHGEPITFGFKVAGWLAETERNRSRLERLEADVAVGQISGANGHLCQHRSTGGSDQLRHPRINTRHSQHPSDLP
jgi:adenylosuccinate lyase